MRNEAGEHGYRLDRRLLRIGVFGTAFVLAIGTASVAAALWNTDGSFARPVSAALFFGVFWSMFLLLGVYITTSAVRSRLYIDADGVRQVGCFRAGTLRWEDVQLARWRMIPRGGSLCLHDGHGRLTVEFGSYVEHDRYEIIALFRDLLREHVQDGWAEFEAQILRRGTSSA